MQNVLRKCTAGLPGAKAKPNKANSSVAAAFVAICYNNTILLFAPGAAMTDDTGLTELLTAATFAQIERAFRQRFRLALETTGRDGQAVPQL